jgi:hypothetical protein
VTALSPRRRLAGRAEAPASDVFAPIHGLAMLADDLTQRPLGPSAAFRDALREHLLEQARRPPIPAAGRVAPAQRGPEATAEKGAAAPTAGSPVRRMARRTAAAGLVLALGGGGVAVAAGHALPGDPLYGVKRLTEAVRLALTPGATTAPGDLNRVSLRLGEAERLAAPSGAAGSAATNGSSPRWGEFDSAVTDMHTALVRLAGSTPPEQLAPPLEGTSTRLQRLLPLVPAGQQAELQRTIDLIGGIRSALPLSRPSPFVPFSLLGPGPVTTSRALTEGWPLDLSEGAGLLAPARAGAKPGTAVGSAEGPSSGTSTAHKPAGRSAAGTRSRMPTSPSTPARPHGPGLLPGSSASGGPGGPLIASGTSGPSAPRLPVVGNSRPILPHSGSIPGPYPSVVGDAAESLNWRASLASVLSTGTPPRR